MNMKCYRAKNLTDYQFIARLYSNPKNNRYLFTKRMTAAEVKNSTKNKRRFWYVCVDNGKYVGAFNIQQAPNGITGRFGLVIDYRYRGKGYGHQAMYYLESEGIKLGIKTLIMEVFIGNTRAINLYQKMGYKKTATLLAMEKKLHRKNL